MLKHKNTQPFYKDFWFWVKILIFAVFLLFLVYPFSTLVINSFFSGKEEGFTLYNFNRFFSKKYYYQALGNSLKVSLVPTITSILIGVPMAYLMTRFNIAGKTFWHVIIILSLMCPPFLGAYSWIILFGNAGVVTQWLTDLLGFQMPSIYGMGGICAVFTLKLFPYVYLYVSGAMGSIDRSVEECAENLGSGKLRRLLTVTIPVVMPSIAAGALMVFMTALADFGTPGILAGGDFRTLPVLIFNEYLSETGGNANLASAISMIIVVISLVILFLQKWWVARKNYTMSALRPPQITEYQGWKRFLVTLPVAVVSLVSFLPQVIVIFCSFVKTNYSNFVFSEGFTLEHYQELGRSLVTNIRNSFVFSTVAILFILVLGILMSYVIVRRRGKTGGALDMLMMAPYVIPGSVLGLCYIVAFNNLGKTADGTVIKLTGTASWNHVSLKADPEAFDWTVEGGIGTVDPLGNFTASTPGTGTITVSGKAGGEEYVQEIPVANAAVDTEDESIRYLWARTKLDQLAGYGSIRNDDSVKDEITKLGLDYNMTTPYTSFVAVVEEIRNPEGEAEDVNQATPLPLQVSNLAVGGGYTAYSEPGGILLGVILTVVSFCGARRQFRKRRQTARLLNRQTEV